MQNIVLISKDVLRKDYLPVYGNSYWKTPNIDELASKGTVFYRHYTAAPSTAMSFTSMFTGLYPFQTGRTKYIEVSDNDKAAVSETLFDMLEKKGYSCHMLWSSNYVHMAERFSKCFGKHTVHHDTLELNQYVGAHMKGMINDIPRNDGKTEEVYSQLIKEIDTIDMSNPVFLWVHLPHVFAGRTGYGDDIDILDRFVGDIRKRFGDFIYITADHGCGNGKDGVTGYGFDLYESQICIPLISPLINDSHEIRFPTSNTQLIEFLVEGKVTKREYVLSDTAYYQQPHRKLAVISGPYKYIYRKQSKTESMFDVEYDREENIDLNKALIHDKDRNRDVIARQVLFYPYWNAAEKRILDLRDIKDSIWKDVNVRERIKYGPWRRVLRNMYIKYNESKIISKRKRENQKSNK